MATKFYLAEIPDDFPATNVKFENMTKPLLAIPAKMVDGKPITIVGYINAGQKKYKANDYGFVEFNDNGSSFVQFKNTDMDTRYSVAQKASGDVLGYLPLETGELVGIVREKEKPILLLIIAVIVVSVDGGTMTNTAGKTAAVTVSNQTKSKWSRADLLNDGTSATCKVSAELDPGHWTGTATFSCEKQYK